MLDLTQVLLVVAIVVLTGILTFVGIQLVLVLKDIRLLLVRTNNLIDQAEQILDKVSHPTQSLNNLLTGLREGINMVETVTSLFKNRAAKKNLESYEVDLP